MTDQPCPKCLGQGYILRVYNRAPGDPPGNAVVLCDCTRADPALVYGETASTVHNYASGQQTVHNTQQCPNCDGDGWIRVEWRGQGENRTTVHRCRNHIGDRAPDPAPCKHGPFDGCEQCYVEPDNAQQSAREGEFVTAEQTEQFATDLQTIVRHRAECMQQLAAKDAEIKTRDTLIRQLTDALREATEYVEATHASIKGAVGHDNVVLPILKRCQEAIAAAERHEKGGNDG